MPAEGYILVETEPPGKGGQELVGSPHLEQPGSGLNHTDENLCRDFGETRAVRDLNLEVKQESFSGSWDLTEPVKTTTMRMLAEFSNQHTVQHGWMEFP